MNDGEWHWVEFYRERDDFTLMIDHECNDTKKVSSRYFKPKMLYVAGGPRNVLMKSDSKQNYSGYLQEFYFGKKKIFDSIVPTITDRRFAKIGTVIDGSITFEGSGGSGCLLLGDDEDEECPKTEISTTTTGVSILYVRTSREWRISHFPSIPFPDLSVSTIFSMTVQFPLFCDPSSSDKTLSSRATSFRPPIIGKQSVLIAYLGVRVG